VAREAWAVEPSEKQIPRPEGWGEAPLGMTEGKHEGRDESGGFTRRAQRKARRTRRERRARATCPYDLWKNGNTKDGMNPEGSHRGHGPILTMRSDSDNAVRSWRCGPSRIQGGIGTDRPASREASGRTVPFIENSIGTEPRARGVRERRGHGGRRGHVATCPYDVWGRGFRIPTKSAGATRANC
jgi:hypothetical protein